MKSLILFINNTEILKIFFDVFSMILCYQNRQVLSMGVDAFEVGRRPSGGLY